MTDATPIKPPALPGSRLRPWLNMLAAVGFAVLSAYLARYGIYIPPHVPEQQPAPQQPAPQQPAPPKVEPQQQPNAPAAIVRITFGNAGCSATIIGPRREDGRWWVLTAAHCIGGQGQRGQMKLLDGRTFALSVVAFDKVSDCCWCVTAERVEALPFALLAKSSPNAGARVWHAGYGFDRPGNREDGEVIGSAPADGQIVMTLNVSSGDSGGGILLDGTNEVVSCVCCTTHIAARGKVWGASPESIAKLQRAGAANVEWEPCPMPTRPAEVPDVLPGEGSLPRCGTSPSSCTRRQSATKYHAASGRWVSHG